MDDAPFMIPFIKVGGVFINITDISHTATVGDEFNLRVYFKGGAKEPLNVLREHEQDFYKGIEQAEKAGIIILFQQSQQYKKD